MRNALINGDSLEILKKFPDNSFDSMVTDPPAGISFMGKKWDKDKGGRKQWIAWLESIMTEAFRTLKPGAHILVWAIPRTSHWTATAIENADFEIRDVVTHIFGSGFPKSHNIGKKIKEFEGWGSALKPASEHWILARKPLSEKTIVANVLEHGTGGINIDASRISLNGKPKQATAGNRTIQWGVDKGGCSYEKGTGATWSNEGRFPANLILSHKPGCKQVGIKEGKGYTINRFTDGAKPFGDGAGHPYEVEDQGPETIALWDCADDCAVKEIDNQSGTSKSTGGRTANISETSEIYGSGKGLGQKLSPEEVKGDPGFGDVGGASRFYKNFEWECEDDCAIKEINEQSGIIKGVVRKPTGKAVYPTEGNSVEWNANNVKDTTVRGFDDTGGAARFFKQVEWDCEDDCAVKQLDEQSIAGGMHTAGRKRTPNNDCKQTGDGGMFGMGNHERNGVRFGDKGGASRFFYVAKASKKEKTLNKTIENKHPTVKSLKLMKYLINLITPPGGVVLDPFMGSGTTGQAALEDDFGFVGIEKEENSFEICQKRCSTIKNVITNKKIVLDLPKIEW